MIRNGGLGKVDAETFSTPAASMEHERELGSEIQLENHAHMVHVFIHA
jgi:hypothetical protein